MQQLRQRGFTLLELLVVIVIIGLLAGYVAPRYFSQVGKSEIQVARAQIDALEKALDQYRLDKRRYPTAEEGLAAIRPYLKKAVPTDPWGRAVRVPHRGTKGDFELFSLRPRRQVRRHRATTPTSAVTARSRAAGSSDAIQRPGRRRAAAGRGAHPRGGERSARRRPGARPGADRGLDRARPAMRLRDCPGAQPRFPTTLFSMELASLLDAGLNLVEALQTLAEKDAQRRAPRSARPACSPRSAAASRSRRRWRALAAALLAALRGDHQGGRAHRQPARGARPLHRLPGGDRAREEEDRLRHASTRRS